MSLEHPGNQDDGTDDQKQEPVITMPEEKRQRIEEKLAHYHSRLAKNKKNDYSYRPPETFIGDIPEEQIRTVYKIAIAKELLRHGKVDTYVLSQRLSAEHRGFNANKFTTACEVLRCCCNGREDLIIKHNK